MTVEYTTIVARYKRNPVNNVLLKTIKIRNFLIFRGVTLSFSRTVIYLCTNKMTNKELNH